jgi:hypothetical protein
MEHLFDMFSFVLAFDMNDKVLKILQLIVIKNYFIKMALKNLFLYQHVLLESITFIIKHFIY